MNLASVSLYVDVKNVGRCGMHRRIVVLGSVLFLMLGSHSYAFQKCIWNSNYVEFSGKVSGISPPVAFVVSRGSRYVLRLGPYWFWQRQGYRLLKGESVKVKGWLCGKMVFPKEIVKGDGSILKLRDSRGVPLWRRGRGWGRGIR